MNKQLDALAQLKKVHSDIDPQAISILKRLKDAGFEAYLVGGCVRDLLVGIKPKDFDIATNASPQEVKRKVPFSFIIGRRFKLVHTRRGEKIFEVATYRRQATDEELQNQEDQAIGDENFFGTLSEDSFRRDFTINAMYYDPISESFIDHCNGIADIATQTLRTIGHPSERIKEDPIRVLRALRLSQKLGFTIENEFKSAIVENIEEIKRAILPRRREEWIKFFRLASIDLALIELYDLKIFEAILPTLHQLFLDENKQDYFRGLIRRMKIVGFDMNDTYELFAGVVYSYLLTQYEHPSLMNMNEISEKNEFQFFWKEELGVFKAEITAIETAIKYMNAIRNIEAFEKKGERRKRAMIYHPNFQLALKLGLLSNEFDSADFAFWMEQFEVLQ